MPTDDRRWTDADQELAAQAIRDNNPPEAWATHPMLIPAHHYAAAALDAAAPLIAARVRADEREALARMLVDHAAREPDGSVDQVVMMHAAELVRTYATTEEDHHAA